MRSVTTYMQAGNPGNIIPLSMGSLEILAMAAVLLIILGFKLMVGKKEEIHGDER